MSQKKSPKPSEPGPRRGKRARGEHWINDIEKALEFNHADIARLLTPEPLSIDAMWDILTGRYDTPALAGLKSPITARAVSRIIAGESSAFAEKAEAHLSERLGFQIERHPQGHVTFHCHPELRYEVEDDCPFGEDSVATYLGMYEQRMRYEFGRIGSPFVATSPPIPIPPSNMIRLG